MLQNDLVQIFISNFYNPNVNNTMFIRMDKEQTSYTRVSKLGQEHEYFREKSVAVFRCDNCGEIFTRDRGSIDPKRLNNNYFHCCSNCDSKRFAQKKGVERKKIWDLPASSLKTIGRI
jgi:hypothetical protein